MKKFFVFVFSVFLLTNCSVTTYYTKGNISLYDNNGSLMKEWNDAIIESEEGGFLNFSSDNKQYLINGGIIIIEDINEVNTKKVEKNNNENDYSIRYKEIKKEIANLKTQLKANKNTKDNNKIRQKIKNLEEEKNKIEKYYKEEYYKRRLN